MSEQTRHPEEFDCDTCGETRRYQMIEDSEGRRFPFASLIFGRDLRPVLRCDGCGAHTPASSATHQGSPIANRALRGAVYDLLAGMAVSDGEVLAEERDLMHQILSALRIPHEPLDQRLADWSSDRPDDAEVLALLDSFLPWLDRKARDILLEAAYHLAVVDKHFHENELAFLKQLAKKLSIKRGEFEIILDLADAGETFFSELENYVDHVGDPAAEENASLVFRR